MYKTVILSAPSRWGKTRLAAVLRKGFGCRRVVDEWAPDMPITPGALHLTNSELNKLPPSTEAVTVLRFP